MQDVMHMFNVQLPQSYTDSANVPHTMPLYERVKQNIDAWRELGTAQFVLNWIESGVYFEP